MSVQYKAYPYRAPSVRNSRGTSRYLPLSVIGDPNGDFREIPRGSAALTGVSRDGDAVSKELFRIRQLEMILYQRWRLSNRYITTITLYDHHI